MHTAHALLGPTQTAGRCQLRSCAAGNYRPIQRLIARQDAIAENFSSACCELRSPISGATVADSSHRPTEKDVASLSSECGSSCKNLPMTITLRGAIVGGLAVVLWMGLYLLWLWRPEHQVRFHTEHFFHAIDSRNWEGVADFLRCVQ